MESVPVNRAARKRKPPEELFWKRVEKTETCWLWRGKLVGIGYGSFANGAKGNVTHHRAHRFAYALCVGPIPPGMQVLHRCDVPACVRPDHLFLGTQLDNMHDKVAKGRQVRGDRATLRRFPELIKRGQEHPHAKLTDAQVQEIRAGERAPRMLYCEEQARKYGVSWQTIYGIVRRTSWTHVE